MGLLRAFSSQLWLTRGALQGNRRHSIITRKPDASYFNWAVSLPPMQRHNSTFQDLEDDVGLFVIRYGCEKRLAISRRWIVKLQTATLRASKGVLLWFKAEHALSCEVMQVFNLFGDIPNQVTHHIPRHTQTHTTCHTHQQAAECRSHPEAVFPPLTS